MYRILVVDDEQNIRNIVKKYAVFEGHEITEAENGMQAIQICRENVFDIIIMDVMMPELDGFSACREIRKFCTTPILMLSARGEEYDRIHGFEIGVDDYVVKPFSPRELMMRIDAILKRSMRLNPKLEDVFEYEKLQVNFVAHTVRVNGEKVSLSPKEYDLLKYMIENRNIALSRAKLIMDVWGYDFFGDDRTVDTHIKLLRKNLGEYGRLIVTLRGVGYRFETER